MVVVTVSGGTFTVIDSAAVAVTAGFSESVTATVKSLVPGAAGTPLISPVAGTSVSPAGSEPCVTDQVYGLRPPVAASFAEYTFPPVPPASVVVVTCSDLTAALHPPPPDRPPSSARQPARQKQRPKQTRSADPADADQPGPNQPRPN